MSHQSEIKDRSIFEDIIVVNIHFNHQHLNDQKKEKKTNTINFCKRTERIF